jgi:2-oxoisovalerate dehydrogenase E2 component (dihydrolipoyl transacylase)
MSIFKLPDLGEGLPDAQIHEWHVKEGDFIKVDQLLVSMETAKAVVEVPSPTEGKILKLYGNVGDVIDVGSPLVEYITENTPSQTVTAHETTPPPSSTENRHVGATVAGNIEVGDTIIQENAAGITPSSYSASGVKIIPALRILAQKLHLSLEDIPATGHAGQITLDDFAHFIQKKLAQPRSNATQALPEGNYQAIKGVRKAMAHAMTMSHESVVAVTIVDDADITAWPKGTDITCRIIRAIIHACQIEPIFNAWFDGENLAIDIKNDIHLGLAVDSPDGLFVPVIKHAQSLSADEIRSEINRFKTQIVSRTIPAEDLKGATISLSNFGTFAGRYATPVVVPPMVTIVGSGRLKDQLVLNNTHVESHRILPLSVTFDHRAATGGEASRFLKAMIEDLQKLN